MANPPLTFAELSAQLAEIYERFPPLPRMTLALAKLDDVHQLRGMFGAGEPTPPWVGSIGSLTGIPIVIDRELHEGVMEMRAGTTVRRFHLYGDALTREREQALARFLATAEEPEDRADGKAAMEPECLRTGHGQCHRCKQHALIWRYEIDPQHRKFLGCACTEEGDICDRCVSGLASLESGDLIVCGGCFTDTESCTWSEWLDKCALPWLCAACWKAVTAEEIEHVRALVAANPF